jgi:hypothetical protein
MELGSTEAQISVAVANWGLSSSYRDKFYTLPQDGLDSVNKKRLAQVLIECCPDYSFEDIDADHLEVGYTMTMTVNPVFKMALEYVIDEYGLSVRLPANGIRFDDTRYTLEGIEILPYMGVGLTDNGYTLFPDGSGTIFSFEKLMGMGSNMQLSANIYGADYAFQQINGNYEETVRYPVFGLKETQTITKDVTLPDGKTVTESYEQDRGFLAVVEEGESMMTLTNFSRTLAGENAGQLNGVKMTVQPRAKDSFSLDDTAAGGASWEVISAKKFTGSYRVRYIMLTDADRHGALTAQGVNAGELYSCDYVGMAKAYRDYLIRGGVLTKLTSEQVEENIPLYIEVLGAMMTTKKILSIPVDVMTSLTSFENLSTMRDQLAAEGVTNINFVLQGFTDGGLTEPKVPYKLKWEKAVEKGMSFEELIADAKADGYGIFPDFDFVFASSNSLFDGLTLKKHAIKTVQNRYTTKRVYSATKHSTVSTFELALSPAYFSHFYDKFLPKYQKEQPIGMSVSTLGSYLNTDFDEDEPYNREENKEFTVQALKAINDSFAGANMDVEIMTEAANAYAWKYVDHITDIALDSSRFTESYASVPFLGMVLHGYVELAGTPVNMEGNLDYAMLKSIESGAALQFFLAYENTSALKNDESLSQNFSVQYEIWRPDIISMYHELNDVLKNVQTSTITDHRFISGVRVPDLDELEADALKELEDAIAFEDSLENADNEAEREALFNARQAILKGTVAVLNAMNPDDETSLAFKVLAIEKKLDEQLVPSEENKDQLIDQLAKLDEEEADEEKRAEKKKKLVLEFVNSLYNDVISAMDTAHNLIKLGQNANNAVAILENSENSFDEKVVADLKALLSTEYQAMFAELSEDYTAEKVRDALLAGLTQTFVTDKALLAAEDMPEFTYQIQDKEENVQNGPVNQIIANTRYNSEVNKIVYETYENGATFLLNFNDYRVVVTIPVDGVQRSFTIDAYGYVVLNHGAN